MQKNNKKNIKYKNYIKNYDKNHTKNYNKNYNKYYFKRRYKNYFYKKNDVYYLLGEKKPERPLIPAHLHRNKKIKKGMFFKKPTFKTIHYPFYLNLKLINEYLKKK